MKKVLMFLKNKTIVIIAALMGVMFFIGIKLISLLITSKLINLLLCLFFFVFFMAMLFLSSCFYLWCLIMTIYYQYQWAYMMTWVLVITHLYEGRIVDESIMILMGILVVSTSIVLGISGAIIYVLKKAYIRAKEKIYFWEIKQYTRCYIVIVTMLYTVAVMFHFSVGIELQFNYFLWLGPIEYAFNILALICDVFIIVFMEKDHKLTFLRLLFQWVNKAM